MSCVSFARVRKAILTFAIALPALAQPAASPAFEVVSVRPTPPEAMNRLRQDFCTKGIAHFTAGAVPINWVFGYAYRLKGYQIIDAPAWMDDFNTYDIKGKGSDIVTDAQCRLMVQSILVDRFKLVSHTEMRDMPVYLLTIAKNGPKLRAVRTEEAQTGPIKLNGSVQFSAAGLPTWKDGWDMPALAAYLTDFAGRPVVDHTGIKGMWAITLNYSMPGAPHREGDDFPDLFTAVQGQLGLKLEPGKAPVEVRIIDQVEKPAAN